MKQDWKSDIERMKHECNFFYRYNKGKSVPQFRFIWRKQIWIRPLFATISSCHYNLFPSLILILGDDGIRKAHIRQNLRLCFCSFLHGLQKFNSVLLLLSGRSDFAQAKNSNLSSTLKGVTSN